MPRGERPELSRGRSLALFVVLVVLIVAFDQLSKAHMRAHLVDVGERMPGIPGLFDFVLVHNTGAAFGMLEGAKVLFVALACVVTIGIIVYLALAKSRSRVLTVILALIAGGAIGNVIDRVAFGYVTDFVAVTFIDFPVFNFADMCITCACVLLVLWLLLSSRSERCEEGGEE